jgi:hypothetical protein
MLVALPGRANPLQGWSGHPWPGQGSIRLRIPEATARRESPTATRSSCDPADGQVKISTIKLAMDDWAVCIPEHHPG